MSACICNRTSQSFPRYVSSRRTVHRADWPLTTLPLTTLPCFFLLLTSQSIATNWPLEMLLNLFFWQEPRTCGRTNGGCSQICKNGRCSCYPGYFPSGTLCSPGSCGSPSVQYCPSRTTYGTTCLYPTASCSGKTFGKTCTWVCKSGYGLTGGSSVIICQSSGVWSSYSTTYCKRLNQPPTKVSPKKKEQIYLQICGTFRWRLTS